MTTPIYRILTVASAIGLLTACVPPPTVAPSSNLTLEMRYLRASIDRQEQSVQMLSRQVSELEASLQRQAEEIDQLRQTPQSMQTGPLPAQSPQAQAVASIPAPGEGSATEVYLQAFGDYASGRYQRAIQGFAAFLQRFPNNSYAGNAQFWLGDCYFNQQQYSLAIQEFERVLKDYPNAPKNPDALLKIASARLQLGNTDEARLAIDTLKQRYPKSTAAQKAQELAIP